MEKKQLDSIQKPNLFIWYATRVSFWVMAFVWILLIIFPQYTLSFVGWILGISIIFCFVTSIIHLVKYKEKKFAITALIISSIGLLSFFIGVIVGIAEIVYESKTG